MNRSLVICLLLSVGAAAVAATAALLAGWGWLAAFGLYAGVGSVTLVSAAIALHGRAPKKAQLRHTGRRRVEEDPVYA